MNCLGDEGVKMLVPMLQQSRSLVHLDVSSNRITNLGATALFKALAVNQSVYCFILGNVAGQHKNTIKSEAFAVCPRVLSSNQTLGIFDVNGNLAGNVGLAWITAGAIRSKSLQSLNLGQTYIDPAATNTLIKLLKQSRIRRLDISRNNLKNGVPRVDSLLT
jgi:hypothetical protein